jgi:acetyl esterase/lipase
MLEHVPPRGGLRWRQWLGRKAARTVGRKSLGPGLPVDLARRNLDDGAERQRFPRGVQRRGESLAGQPCAIMTPELRRAGAMLYVHGGGFVVGSKTSHGPYAARLARATGLETFLPDYSLAPEHPFPAALNEMKAAWLKLADKIEGPLVLAGESAGGNLAMSLALRLRDEGLRPPDAVAVVSPWSDLSMSGASVESKAKADPMLSPAGLARASDMYLKGRDRYDPAVSPLFGDMAGLPPVLIQVGSEEILLDDAVRLEDRLAESGVDSLCQVWDGMWHAFPMFAPLVPEAVDAIDAAARWIAAHIDAASREADPSAVADPAQARRA